MARLVWNGDKIVARVEEAAIAAVNETTQAIDDDASTAHWWHNKTGNLERNIITTQARLEGDRVIGRVGVTYSGRKGARSGFYGLFLEMKMPWFRPAVDREAPLLKARLARRLRK